MIKSPLRYPGGKSRGISFLSQFVPPFKELREVFFGGGSFSFYCIQHFPGKHFRASDLNYELYCFWQQLKQNPQDVIAGVQQIFDACKPSGNGQQLFKTILERRHAELTDLQRAIDFFVLNRITFSGVVDSGGYSKGSFDARFTQSAIKRLNGASQVIQPIDFTCGDFTYLIDKPGDDVFLFLDPPYHKATKSRLYGKAGVLHTGFDHERLFDHLSNTPHRWLMTYDNSEFIRELYKGYHKFPWSLQYGMTNTTSAEDNELLISNYDVGKMRKEA